MANKNSVFVDNSAPAVNAEWLNINQTEMNNLITTSGQTVDNTGVVNDQEAIAVASYAAQGGVFGTDSGVADAYVFTQISSFKAPFALKNGLTIRFRAGNANTGACTINACSFGAKSIKKSDGTTNPAAGDIPTTRDTTLRYDLANDVWQLASGFGTAAYKDTGTTSGTLPLIGAQPTFRAYRSTNQSISVATSTKVQFDTIQFNVGSYYDGVTNFRFTPPVGVYSVTAAIVFSNSATNYIPVIYIYKNGVETVKTQSPAVVGGTATSFGCTDLISCNGTDYIEVFGQISAGTSPVFIGGTGTFFSAFKII